MVIGHTDPSGHRAKLGRPLGQLLAPVVVECELAVLHQQVQRKDGELLGQRGRVAHGARCIEPS